MSFPVRTRIQCPICHGDNWKRSWTGRFSEMQYLTWQRNVATPQYELKFDNEDQYDTDTEPWHCTQCDNEADEITAELLEAAL